PTDSLQGVPFGGQVRQKRAEALGPRVPAEDQPQAQEVSVDLPLPPEFDPLAFGECGGDGLERLVAPRAQACAVLAKGLDNVRRPPRFGPDEQAAALLLDAAQS